MSVNSALLAASLASSALLGVAASAYLGLRRAARGANLLNAPASPEQREQLAQRGRTHRSSAASAAAVLLVVTVTLWVVTFTA